MATGRDELASWNPMDEDYRDETFNSYDRGPGKNLPRNSQRRTGVNLYVTNIPNSVTSEGLKNLFGRCGLVKDARVCVSKFTTQYNTTFGFVVMENTSGGTEALRLMNGFKIGNVQLTVKIAKTDEEKQKEKEEREANEEFLNSLPSMGQHRAGSYQGSYATGSYPNDNFIFSKSGEKIHFGNKPGLTNGIHKSPGEYSSPVSPGGASGSALSSVNVDPTIFHTPVSSHMSKTPMKLSDRFENLKITPSDRGRKIDVLEDNIPLVVHTNDDENDLDEMGSEYGGGYRDYDLQRRDYMPFNQYGRGGYGRGRGQSFGYVNHMNKPGYGRGYGGYGNYRGNYNRPMGRGGVPYHQHQYRPPYYQQQGRPMGRGMGNFQQQYRPHYHSQQFQNAPYGHQGSRPATNSINYKPAPQKPSKVEVRPCNVCQKEGTFQCGKCRTPYCCRDCQAKDWPTHKTVCNQLRSEREQEDMIESQFEISVGDDIVEKMVKTVEQHTGNKVEVGKKVPPQQKSKDFSRSTQQRSPRAMSNHKSPQGISQKSPGTQSNQKSPQNISQKSPKPNQQNTGHVSQKKSPVGGTSQRSPAGATIGQKTPQKSPRMTAEQKLSIPPTNLPIGSEVDVIVLAVTSPGSIVVQVFDHEMVQAAVEQDAKMTEIYNQDHTQVSCPAVGDFLVGNYMGNWYRLQVNQVISPDKFLVTYVDYGNKETVSLAELRYLKPEMVNIPAQAIECCLECVGDVNSSNNWSPASISRVQELVPPTVTSSVLYKVKATKADGGVTHIKLIDGNGVDVGDKLLSEGLVGSVQTQLVPSLRSPTGGTSQRSPDGATGSQKTPQKSPRMAAEQKPSIPPTKLPMGNEVDVIVLAVTSPGSIVVQVFDHEMVQAAVEQDARMTEIYNQDHTQVSCPAVGDFLVGNYMGNWYRLQVNQVISTDKFQVTYVDYGNKETVSLAEMRYLKSDLCTIPAQAIECCLDGINDPNWSPASIERVKELVPPTVTAGVLYKAKAVKDDGNITSIKLTDGNGDDVGNKLLSEGLVGRSVQTQQVPSLKSPVVGASQRSPASATGGQRLSQGSITTVAEQKSLIPSTILPIGSEVDVIVLAVTSPGSIVVQVFDHEMVQAAVDQDARMTEIYNQDHTQVSCPAVGDFLVGNYMGNWYRLQVNQVISPDKFQVTYVDYGNKETVSLAEMRYLKPDMLNIPAQAIECCLEGIGDPNWSPASIERVKELVPPTLTAGVLYKAKAVRMEGNLSCIKLLDGNGVDIGDTLLSEGLVSTAGKKSEVFMAKSLGNISDLMTEGGEFDLFVIDKKPPNRLVCQVLHRDYVEMFTQFQQAFLELMEKDTSTEYKPQCVGELVVGRFSGDQMWYRAEVLALTDTNATLCYVDFGNKEQVPFTSIRHAVEICTRLPIQSFVCVPVNQCSLEQAVKISAVVKKKENSEVLIQIQDAMGLTSENTEETVPKVQDAAPRKIMYSDIQKIQLPVNGSKVAMTFSDASSLYSFHLRKCDSESQAELDKVMKDVHEYCTKNVDPYKPEVNEMVCVQFSADGAWYRGRVTNIEGDAYSVQYVDHGNSENVSVKAIRKIDPSLLVTPLQSVHCRVAGMMPELQTNDMVGVFATAMQSPIIHVQAKHVGADVTDVVIFLTDGTNLNEVMLGADNNNEVKVSPAVSSKPATVSPKPSAPPAVQNLNKSFTVPQLQVPLDGSRINVTVTDLLGLCSFAAQSLENMQEFAQMSSRMGEFCESLKEKHTPAIDEIVFAKFSADNQWYRAKVVECIATENFHLTFIDYGNSDIVQSSCIRKMTTEFTALPAQSFQCKLSGVMEEGQPEDALMTFAGKVLNNQLQLQAIKKKNDVYEVELFSSDGVSINNMFKVIAAPATASVPSPITNGVGSLGGTKLADIEKVQPKEQCSLLITHVNSPKDFYCQIADEDNIQLLGVLMNNLALECAVDTPNDNFKPVEGDLCCAKYEVDDGWYRSFIKAVLDDGRYRVHYLDFGNEGVVSGTGVHPPSEEFFKLPMMAFQCSLIGIDPSGSSWTPASVAKMNEFQMRELSAIIKSKEKDVLQVQVSWEGTDLADCLVQAGLARKATVGPAGDAAAMSEEEKEAIQRQIAQLQAMIGKK